MSVDTSKLINISELNHYNSRLQEQVIAPIQEAIDNVATNVDVGYYCFSAGTITNATKSSIQTMPQSQIETVNADDVTDMSELFQNRSDITSLDLSNWDVSDVTDMTDMFDGCSNLTSLRMSGSLQTDLDLSDTALTAQSANEFSEGIDPKVINEDVGITMPRSAKRMNRTLATSKGYGVTITPVAASIVVTNANMYDFSSNVKKGTYDADFISRADVSAVTSMYNMFNSCAYLTTLDLSDWDVSSVTYMGTVFYNCPRLTSLDLSGWDTSSVTDMNNMFSNCSSLTSLDLSSWDVSSVTGMNSMFTNCSSLASLNLSGWDVSSVMNMNGMFYYCSSLASLNLSGWDVSSVENMSDMFSGCSSLTSLLIGGAINTNLDLSSTKLTPQAANAFFNGISAKTTANAVTITMPSTAQGADISIATAKGYTISGIS